MRTDLIITSNKGQCMILCSFERTLFEFHKKITTLVQQDSVREILNIFFHGDYNSKEQKKIQNLDFSQF